MGARGQIEEGFLVARTALLCKHQVIPKQSFLTVCVEHDERDLRPAQHRKLHRLFHEPVFALGEGDLRVGERKEKDLDKQLEKKGKVRI